MDGRNYRKLKMLKFVYIVNKKRSILFTKPQTKSRWFRFLHVVSADIRGGYSLGKTGDRVGACFGPKGAVVGAAGALYLADRALGREITMLFFKFKSRYRSLP